MAHTPPVSEVCPACGSPRYKELTETSLGRGPHRACEACKTVYRRPWGIAWAVLGSLLASGVLLWGLVRLFDGLFGGGTGTLVLGLVVFAAGATGVARGAKYLGESERGRKLLDRTMLALGPLLILVVFGGMGLMNLTDQPSKNIALSPDLASVAKAKNGEVLRLAARVVSIDGNTVELEDSSGTATATVSEDLSYLAHNDWIFLKCSVAAAGAKPKLSC